MFLGAGESDYLPLPPSPAGGWGGNVFQALISNIKRFPFQLFHFKALQIFFFDFQLWSRQETDKKVCRWKDIRNGSLFPFVLYHFRNFKETLQLHPLCKQPLSPIERNLLQVHQHSPHSWSSKTCIKKNKHVFNF